MGGIGDIETEKLCVDLCALCGIARYPNRHIPPRICWIFRQPSIGSKAGALKSSERTVENVPAISSIVPVCKSTLCPLIKISLHNPSKQLILQGIPSSERIADLSILQKGIQAGKGAEKIGEYYHPAVNRQIDILTEGYSSRLQLKSLINNVRLAKLVVKH